MNSKIKDTLKITGALVILVVGVGFLIARGGAFFRSGEDGTKVWFYDESEKELYSVANGTIPPQKGIGGKSGDGVRAIVVSYTAKPKDRKELQVAYLQTYSPELKTMLENVHAARASGKPYTGKRPDPESDFFQSNTLVRRIDESSWHPINTQDGADITTEWRSWKGPKGETPVVNVP